MNPKKTVFPFDPDWVVAPGETLKEWREDNGLPLRAAAKACYLNPETYEGVEAGTEPITEDMAQRLALGTQITAPLWLNLERVYRTGLKAGKKSMGAGHE